MIKTIPLSNKVSSQMFYTKVVSKWPIDVGPYPMNLYHNKNSKFGGNELNKWG